jgi:hypothetical protein
VARSAEVILLHILAETQRMKKRCKTLHRVTFPRFQLKKGVPEASAGPRVAKKAQNATPDASMLHGLRRL